MPELEFTESDIPEKRVRHTKDISDGYHTFGELYAHRHALFIALLKMNIRDSGSSLRFNAWWTRKHHPDNDPMFEMEGAPGILVGLDLREGSVQYHMPASYIPIVSMLAVEIEHGPHYDGTDNPESALYRLRKFAGIS